MLSKYTKYMLSFSKRCCTIFIECTIRYALDRIFIVPAKDTERYCNEIYLFILYI